MDLRQRIAGRVRTWLFPPVDPLDAHRFAARGRNVRAHGDVRIEGAEGMALGDDVELDRDVWLTVVPGHAEGVRLRIERGSYLGMRAIVSAAQSVVLEEKAFVGHGVLITDNNHCYEDPTRPIGEQGISEPGAVVIGRGTWIGVHTAIVGARGRALTIGAGAVVGPNSVVLRDVPPATVVAGNPARVIRRYDFDRATWVRVRDAEP